MNDHIEMYAQANLDIEKDDIEIIDLGYSQTRHGGTLKVLDTEKNIISFKMEKAYGEPEESFLGRARFKAAGLFRHLWDNPLLLCHLDNNKIVGIVRIFTVDQIPDYDWGKNIIIVQAERHKGETIDDVITRVKEELNNKYQKQRGDQDG